MLPPAAMQSVLPQHFECDFRRDYEDSNYEHCRSYTHL